MQKESWNQGLFKSTKLARPEGYSNQRSPSSPTPTSQHPFSQNIRAQTPSPTGLFPTLRLCLPSATATQNRESTQSPPAPLLPRTLPPQEASPPAIPAPRRSETQQM